MFLKAKRAQIFARHLKSMISLSQDFPDWERKEYAIRSSQFIVNSISENY
jgi:hypothetical protein